MMREQCPRCHGKGTFAAFVDTATDGWYDPAIKCDLCKGTGSIAAQIVEWLEIGRAHYERRIARDESIMECARRLGIRAAELSSMEHGRADPARLRDD